VLERRWLMCAAVVPALVGVPVRADEGLSARVHALAAEVNAQVVEWRRDFHAHPERSNCEERTARVVAERLKALGVEEIRTGVARHGVVAVIRGKHPGPTVALRADMDALPIQEQTDLPFASQNPGVMHACGHDAHTAMLLGAAALLVKLRGELRGDVKLVFQPAEEGSPPGEKGGAELMVEEGVLDNPKVAAIFGLHVDPNIDAGTLGTRPGALMAGVDRFRITVRGKQSHAAMPWQGVDPIVAAAHIITAIQTIPSRHIDARQPVVVSVGIFQAGTAWNIIPGEAHMEGTIRTHDPEVRKKVAEEFRRLVEQTAAAHGAQAEIGATPGHAMVLNDPELTARMKPSLLRAVGQGHLIEPLPMMAGEDFSFYQQHVPGVFCFLGVRNPEVGAVHALHNPQMRIDEAALPVGVRTLVLLAMEYLGG